MTEEKAIGYPELPGVHTKEKFKVSGPTGKFKVNGKEIFGKELKKMTKEKALSNQIKCIAKHDCGADYDGVGNCEDGLSVEDVAEAVDRSEKKILDLGILEKNKRLNVNEVVEEVLDIIKEEFGDLQ